MSYSTRNDLPLLDKPRDMFDSMMLGEYHEDYFDPYAEDEDEAYFDRWYYETEQLRRDAENYFPAPIILLD